MFYSNSLYSNGNSDSEQKAKLLLADTDTKLDMIDLRFHRDTSAKIVDQQNVIIFLILAVTLVIGLAFVLNAQNSKRYITANVNLAYSTIEEIENEIVMNDCQPALITKGLNPNLISQLNQLIHTDKVHRDPNLSLVKMAQKLNTNRTYLSRIFNNHYSVSFNDYINELRIKEVCRLLVTSNDKNFTIDHILAYSGFSSKSPFYSAFKKFTGVTPEVYKKMNRLEN